MFQKLSRLVEQYEAQERSMADPEIATDPKRFRQLARQHREIGEVVSRYREYQRLEKQHDEARELLRSEDEEMRRLAEAEVATLTGKLSVLEGLLKRLLVPKDPNDTKNVILEVRAGTGGDEATLFAADVLRMYARYIERRRWKMQSLNRNETGIGGIREAICLIEGERVYSRLKYESGVHRVQRVPATEASGRIHTSTVTVAMLPEAEEVDIKIEEKDLRIDTYCSSGPGGQSVNTTYSAVRITHLPTGLVVTCQDEKSQIKNRARAMQVLRSRLYEIAREEEERKRSQDRRSQVGTGERSEKIRTYNFKENRVTDHRIHLTLHKLHDILDGDLDELIDHVTVHFEAERMRADEPAETAASS